MTEQDKKTNEETEPTAEEVEIIEPDTEESVPDEEVEQSEEDRLQNELNELKQKVLRQQADYDNFRKRTRMEKESDAKYRSQKLIESLLPAMDNFKRALDHAPQSEEAESIHKGMTMVYEQLQESLRSEGLTEIKTEGEPFDPNFHQAVMQVEEEGFESNQVVEELQKGYQLKDRVIRPAMVKVNA
ncbi:heat shock protein GrpE [Geomicrobium sp. JCM 19037]|uniref:nucleotide exchange factor GrpE n=1 Tax=unclassified Geomicrobium TaxID=2628951 RepID=UPI00045F30CB|nr:nucleotide exchange factor GrpE [Geomicrobium sp. JCM 19037]GAK04162.1 heat shock protein GrpE [Geomicrobium sp. JCM 19037]